MALITRRSRTVALVSVFGALCLAVQLVPRPPSVEFTSFLTFSVGFILSPFLGAAFGGFVMFVNGFLSPFGFAGINMPFQIVGMSTIGLAGGLYKKHTQEYGATAFSLEAAILGASLTVFYDLTTNLGYALFLMTTGVQPTWALTAAVAYGMPIFVLHLCTNIVVFGAVFNPLIKAAVLFQGAKDLG